MTGYADHCATLMGHFLHNDSGYAIYWSLGEAIGDQLGCRHQAVIAADNANQAVPLHQRLTAFN
ncbi:MAG: hypothetical protein ABJC87_21140 [Roseobacter sp.]